LGNPLSYNISGGSARHQKVKPKTWRIFTFADARMTPLVLNPRCSYHWPTAILGFRRQFHPPGFLKKPERETLLKVLYIKNIKKNAQFLHGFMMPQFFIKKKHFFLPVRCILNFFCASFVLKIGYEFYKYIIKRRCTAAGIFLPLSLFFMFYFAIWAGYSFYFSLVSLPKDPTSIFTYSIVTEMPQNDGQMVSIYSPNLS
jgi:hypothetical protein